MPDTTEQWTLMKDGTALITFTSMLEANVQSDSAVLEEPLEQGSFAAFNRVQYSDVFRVKLAIEGDAADLQKAQETLKQLKSGTDTFSLVTPDYEHENLTLEERVWKALGNIYDPEIPVDIVNLGLVYGVEVIPQQDGGSHVNVQMTLTAPGCGMGPHLMAEAEMNIAALDGVKSVDVEFVWDPPWNQDMMSEEARMELGLI